MVRFCERRTKNVAIEMKPFKFNRNKNKQVIVLLLVIQKKGTYNLRIGLIQFGFGFSESGKYSEKH